MSYILIVVLYSGCFMSEPNECAAHAISQQEYSSLENCEKAMESAKKLTTSPRFKRKLADYSCVVK